MKTTPQIAPSCTTLPRSRTQRGFGLVELMVGMAIGLLIVAAGLGSIIVSRVLSGTVGEASTMQQQASYAFRVMGQQIRQAGGRMLLPAADSTEYGVFDETPGLSGYVPVQGKSAPTATEYALELTYQNTEDRSYPLASGKPQMQPLLRNCLGENLAAASAAVINSRFKLDGSNLVCAGSGTPQVLISGVAAMEVRYLVQPAASSAAQQFTYALAESMTAPKDWLQVYAVEVCLELVGAEKIDTAGTTYTRCDKTQAARDNRLRMVFRNTFFINNRLWTVS